MRKRSRYLVPLTALVLVFGYFVWNCSGLNFPIWDPQGRLESHLVKDLNIRLPSSAKVMHSSRLAYSDPVEYYAVEMAVSDVVPFLANVRSAAHRAQDDDDRVRLGLPTPDWWKPGDIPQVQRLDVFEPNS